MSIYSFTKNFLTSFLLKNQLRLKRFYLVIHYRQLIKSKLKNNNVSDLSKSQKKSTRQYYKSHGYNIKLSWHQFFTASNTIFSTKYLPDDIFHSFIASRLNTSRQWPALLDKNLLEVLFKDYKQPQSVIKNINGFYYINNKPVSEKKVVDVCSNISEKLVIKPSIDSGGGKDVIGFYVKDSITTYKNLRLIELLQLFKKNFIVQKVVSQNEKTKLLNASSLNTLRILSYLKNDQVYIISTIFRIGKTGMFTDNNHSGGIAVGVSENGNLKKFGYFGTGERTQKTDSGVELEGFRIPYIDEAKKMVEEMHHKVPYFRIISWDVAIDEFDEPILIEYNTYRQDIRIHQLANGPVFENVLDEFLKIGKS